MQKLRPPSPWIFQQPHVLPQNNLKMTVHHVLNKRIDVLRTLTPIVHCRSSFTKTFALFETSRPKSWQERIDLLGVGWGGKEDDRTPHPVNFQKLPNKIALRPKIVYPLEILSKKHGSSWDLEKNWAAPPKIQIIFISDFLGFHSLDNLVS